MPVPRRNALLLLAAPFLGRAFAQSGADLPTPEVRRVGARLACLCGVCADTVGGCQMIGCHYCVGVRRKIREMQAQGVGDDSIIASIVKEQGRRALAAPPSEGFYNLAWWMPGIMVGFGLALIYSFVKRAMSPAAQPAPSPVDARVVEKYRESLDKTIDKDLESLD